jgi:thymidine kinase
VSYSVNDGSAVQSGQIEVICGPMFSGKTEELIRRLRRAQIARQKVVVFKPCIDNRYDETKIVSHSAQRLPSIPIDCISKVHKSLKKLPGAEVVGIDEAQFFDDRVVDVSEELANRGVRVVVAGLDQDYLGQPFGPIPKLLAVAESITKQLAVCMVCGAPAGRSQRVHARRPEAGLGSPSSVQEDQTDQVLVGAAEVYEARCRRCFVRGIDTPSQPLPTEEALEEFAYATAEGR